MKVLVIGGGGREHVLAWKLAQSPQVDQVYCAPGNAGTEGLGENVALGAEDVPALVEFAKQNQIDLTVVGPEATLVAGVVDTFQAEHLRIFGPTAAGAQLEGSKRFAKELMRKHAIPTADFKTFTDPQDAITYIRAREEPLVVKADGLAAGKGVKVCSTQDEALDAIDEIMHQRAFGDAGREVVVEERLVGEEASILALTDGESIYMLEPSQDHKPIFDNDEGPNTGGMGAYCPAPVVTDALRDDIERNILVPIVHGLRTAGIHYRGVIYAGLMMTPGGPKVLEFNVRFGDPEAQPVLLRLKTDLVDVCHAVIDGTLDQIELQWAPRPAVCVVMASAGYPASSQKGIPITGLEEADEMDDVVVFHAGTAKQDGQIVTHGGRVLGVTALGDTIAAAQQRAYEAVAKIQFQGAQYRTDIAAKALLL